MRESIHALVSAVVVFALTPIAAAQNLVDLTWQPALQIVPLGAEVQIDLEVSSSVLAPESFSGLDAIVSWDPNVLFFLGHDDTFAGYDWFAAGFLPDPDGINTDQSDGEAIFTALATPGTPAIAPGTGTLLVTSLKFLTISSPTTTQVSLTPSAGTYGATRVMDYETAGLEITGDISMVATIDIVAKTQVYCTAKVNSLGCIPAIDFLGTPSVSDPNPFLISTDMVLNFRNGLLFYGYTGSANIPFFGGTLCVDPPLRRTPIQNAGGTLPPASDCTGQLSFDFNALIQSGLDPLLVSGTQINCQFWARDPLNLDGTGTSLSDGLEFVISD